MEKFFARSIQSLGDVFSFLDLFQKENPMNDPTAYQLRFAVEEIFTNMVKYNPHGPEKIALHLTSTHDEVTACLLDAEETPFDPTKRAPINFHQLIEKRSPGGLAIHLTKEMADGSRMSITKTKAEYPFLFAWTIDV